jgi:hypothetical protein
MLHLALLRGQARVRQANGACNNSPSCVSDTPSATTEALAEPRVASPPLPALIRTYASSAAACRKTVSGISSFSVKADGRPDRHEKENRVSSTYHTAACSMLHPTLPRRWSE